MDWTQFPTIHADRVSLRTVTNDDVDALYRIFSHPDVMRYWGAPPLADRNSAIELVKEIHDGFQQQRALKWGIAKRTDDYVIGTATLFNFNFDNGRAEIGYSLARDHWGNGYCNEALTALLNYAFDELNLRRIEADVDPRNGPSIRTLERLGFQREGYLRERWHVNGEIQDSLFYGLLRREWENRGRSRRQEQEAAAVGSKY
ncbi:MAG TPA: GNAT family protein [Pyrinomonadaceae bacterium]|nr:GNAT family protein [Pyrinomonadaceae bacterium]